MPTKTNFLNLSKIQKNEYYNTDIENQNLDKIDQVFREYEFRTTAVENKVNKKDKLQISLSSNQQVQSVDDSFGGPCDFEIVGTLVEQCIRNGNFKNTDNWEGFSYSNLLASQNVLKVTATGSMLYSVVQQLNMNLSGKYFLYSNVKVDNSNCSSINIQVSDGTWKIVDERQSPVSNREYELMGKVDLSNGKRLMLQHIYPSKEIAVNKCMYLKNVICVKISDEEYNNLTEDDLKFKYAEKFYFEGLQPLRNMAIESVGKNLFDKNKAEKGKKITSSGKIVIDSDKYLTNYIVVKPGKIYSINRVSAYALFDGNYNYISGSVFSNSMVTIPNNPNIKYLRTYGSFNTSPMEEFMFVEGRSLPSEYVSYKSSRIIFDDPLAKLPNNLADRIVRENGKTNKLANTNVGRDGEFYIIKESDVTLQGETTNVSYYQIQKRVDSSNYNTKTNTDFYIEGFEISYLSSDDTENIGKVSGDNSNNFYTFAFSKNTSLEEAKRAIANKKLVYRLAIPQNIELSDKIEPSNSYDRYTQFSVEDGVVEHEKVFLHETNSSYVMNRSDFSGSLLKYKNKKILSIKSNGLEILNFGIIRTDLAYGGERWEIQKTVVESNNIDINQMYVDYTTSDANGQANARIKYNADMSSVVSSNASSINAVGEQVDKNTKKVDKLSSLIKWIKPTLLNNWVNYGGTNQPIRYGKDSLGFVHIEGAIASGKCPSFAFILPENYRPSNQLIFCAPSVAAFGHYHIDNLGNVSVDSGNNGWISINCSFYVGFE